MDQLRESVEAKRPDRKGDRASEASKREKNDDPRQQDIMIAQMPDAKAEEALNQRRRKTGDRHSDDVTPNEVCQESEVSVVRDKGFIKSMAY